MTTDPYTQPTELVSTFLCPQCQSPVEVRDVVCSACGVDLAWAAALAERRVLASVPTTTGTPYKGDLLLPRFGEYLLRRGYITEAQLSAGLTHQREAALRGTQQTIGQTLLEMGTVTREQLDLASIEQVRHLQDALQAANRHLEHRVADRTRALQQALQQLAALSELKSNLVGNLSHSLRSPVVPIRGYSSMLVEGRMGPLTDSQRDAINAILRCANQLETAINEIGQFSANLKGHVHVQPTPLSTTELIERLKLIFDPKAEAIQARLRFDLAPNLPALSADAEKVWWALFQLFDQALKVMGAGDELTLAVSAAEGKVKFAVHDMGPSLPPTQCDEIMHLPPEFISRLADARGWSLSQVKRIVEAHGTHFFIESQPERGTLVWFELPVVFTPEVLSPAMRLRFTLAALVMALAGLGLYLQRSAVHAWLFDLTGEEAGLSQVYALGQLALQAARPPLDLRPDVPIAYSGLNPFGINTFLQQEVEPAKREKQVQLIAAAGFHWLRQEFPWSDLEISGKGNFNDCRNGPCVSAWAKYDEIVSLAGRSGLEIVARLSSAPNWSRADGAARGAFAPPDNFTDFADYAAAVADHYRGQVRYFQIWNEPNGNDEWGYQPVDPEAYTRLLCETYHRLKAVDPEIVVLAAALTPTTELGGQNPNGQGGTNMNDLVYLQRMYNAGAKGCFDIMSVQGYGLWSGPTDHRMNPIVINFARNLFIRDLMVRNGDKNKAIWISEMNWNAVPQGSGIAPDFGQVTEAQQARYAPLAYQRLQSEWPWLGVGNFWYFKDADDHEKNLAKYYFRMADPDFTLKPVYAAMKDYTRQIPVMYPGYYQEDHWAVQWNGAWPVVKDPRFEFGRARLSPQTGGSLSFVFSGTDLDLVTRRYSDAGRLTVQVDNNAPQTIDLSSPGDQASVPVALARGLPDGQHQVYLTNEFGFKYIDGFIARRIPNLTGLMTLALALTLGAAWLILRRRAPTLLHD